MDSLLGTKRGMTQIWTEEGQRLPVTVVDLAKNLVTEIRTQERDGYEAVQLGYGAIREKRLAKPQIGQFKKLGVGQRRHLREIRGRPAT
jgi:large subunit ribosomal protein L3